jgi:hypothetical protein
MIFLYMIFGEKERGKTPATQALIINAFRMFSDFMWRLHLLL